MQIKMHYWQHGFGWLVRLLLVLFVVLFASVWGDLLLDGETYDRLFGSEHACSISTDYCSWGNYMRALIFPTVIAFVMVIGLAWRRMPGRETVLYTLAIVAAVYLAGEVLETHFRDYRQ